MEKIIRQLGSIYRSLEYISNKEFENIGLDHNLYAYLVFIVEHPDTILEKLAFNLKVDKTTVSRALKKLESNNFIEKRFIGGNKKEVHLRATEKGNIFYNQVISEYRYSEKRLLSKLDVEQQKWLSQCLDKIENEATKEWETVKNGVERKY